MDGVKASACCEYHNKQGCCDPEDCGPCCERCPTCMTLRMWRLKWRSIASAIEVKSTRCRELNHSQCQNNGKGMASRDRGFTTEDCSCDCHAVVSKGV